ncbi:hypothetical protein [Mesorhizobium sp. DCY119]|uniref:hypothetical protein n=1 Tax=Mesorhizobium sp. DCY119 TaxID=2108445 RepID=UPI000E741947|nr:hypothetical protein [Mesorhizobium sp. DCY119]RJG40577.1 hypothetical protein D3Y55_25215 [Mesorhizobium sp. DCY119]
MPDYEIEIGHHRLSLGSKVDSPVENAPAADSGDRWDLAPGIYSVDGLVNALDLLFEAVVRQLGDAADRESLLDGLEASISTGGSESVLPLDVFTFADAARQEITEQARRIGAALVNRARRANSQRRGERLAGTGQLEALIIRSPCEGYQWTGPVIRQLMGPAGGRNVMQLYNEWLHQFVLLRDSLLPFTNWEQVPLVIGRRAADSGMRMIEGLRERFVAKLLTQRLAHAAIVELAQGLFTGGSPAGAAYGFQTAFGLALPALLGSSLERAPRYLLTWHSAQFIPVEADEVVSLLPLYADYLGAIGHDGTTSSLVGPILGKVSGTFVVSSRTTAGATVQLQLTSGKGSFTSDLGQVLRGHRFLYLPSRGALQRTGVAQARQVHACSAVLQSDLLLQATSGVHVVGASGDPLVALALLGKILPENIVLRLGEEWGAVNGTGKSYGGQFVIDMDLAV